MASPGICHGPGPAPSPSPTLMVSPARPGGALSRTIGQSRACETIGPAPSPSPARPSDYSARGVRVRRRDHQLDYRAVPESDYWRVPRRPAETDYRPVAGPDYWRVPRPADTIGDCRPARLLAPSPGRICNDSRSRGQRLDLQLFIKFVGWESLIHHRIINRIV